MENPDSYLKANQQLWDQKTEVHVDSEFYDMQSFLAGQTSLNEIELSLLGDIRDKSLLHLQCHFGQDTLSLARMGARTIGIDLSEKAVQKAQQLADQLDLQARFIASDVFQLDKKLEGQFDIVFTSYGVIGWLPELKSWARIVDHFLKPGGQFIFVEFHPVVWMFDDDFTKVDYAYFNKEAIIEETKGTYADRNAPINAQSYNWNHSLSDVIGALLERGLQVTHFQEYDYSPYDCFNHTVKSEKGYQIKGMEGEIPMVFSLLVSKNEEK
jgi:2-polyprenyl-3-methyl-5-hydroxy-6-metoxy-1,4-benzoquinol methylase